LGITDCELKIINQKLPKTIQSCYYFMILIFCDIDFSHPVRDGMMNHDLPNSQNPVRQCVTPRRNTAGKDSLPIILLLCGTLVAKGAEKISNFTVLPTFLLTVRNMSE
jgi:hypothetical protein